MAAGKISLQAGDGKICSLTPEDGTSIENTNWEVTNG